LKAPRFINTIYPSKENIIEAHPVLCKTIQAAINTKADALSILNVMGQTSYCDWFVLCNGTNSRQIQAIANNILDVLKGELDVQPLGVEGLRQGRWILIDLGDIIVHIFDEPMRGYYDLDGLWLDAKKVSLEELGLSESPPQGRVLANSA
jgi:ribosome-associated protein